VVEGHIDGRGWPGGGLVDQSVGKYDYRQTVGVGLRCNSIYGTMIKALKVDVLELGRDAQQHSPRNKVGP